MNLSLYTQCCMFLCKMNPHKRWRSHRKPSTPWPFVVIRDRRLQIAWMETCEFWSFRSVASFFPLPPSTSTYLSGDGMAANKRTSKQLLKCSTQRTKSSITRVTTLVKKRRPNKKNCGLKPGRPRTSVVTIKSECSLFYGSLISLQRTPDTRRSSKERDANGRPSE